MLKKSLEATNYWSKYLHVTVRYLVLKRSSLWSKI